MNKVPHRNMPTRIINFINYFKWEEIIWILQFGIPKRTGNILRLINTNFQGLRPPVFFLSTGRCGTQWFANLLKKEKLMKVFHEPQPNLGVQGRIVYEIIQRHNYELPLEIECLIKEIYISSREQYLRYSYKTDRTYVETNNNITFFAPILADLFPEAKFIHLYRHPGEFVRSAIRRKFYSPDNIEDMKRITPVNNKPSIQEWQSYSSIQKNSWLWLTTNQFIDKFKNATNPDRHFTFNFNLLNKDNVAELLRFLEIDIKDNAIKKLINVKHNQQKTGHFPKYQAWNENDKKELIDICGSLAKQYGYEL